MKLLCKSVLLYVLAIICITLFACSGTNQSLTAGRPGGEAFRPVEKKVLSSLTVPIEVSADDLGRAINQSTPRDLYKGSTKTRGVTANILRNGPIAVSAADSYLYCTLPITLSLSYGMFETPAIAVTLKFKANASVTPDWKLVTEIYYLGLSDLLAEEIRIGPISLKPRSIIEGVTQPVQKMLSGVINKKINDSFALRSQVAKVWEAVQKPLLLDKRYNAWLNLDPREVMLSPLYTQNNRVKVNVGITSYAELVVGPEPVTRPPHSLPSLKLVKNFDKNFLIALHADLFYRDMLAIASPLLLNREFESDGKTITIKSLDMYGNGDKLVVKVETRGSLDGVFYLTGKPRIDSRTTIFSVDDLDFDIQSRSLLLQSADWILHGVIKSRIQENLTMDLSRRLEESTGFARKAMAQVQIADHVQLKGNIVSLNFSDLSVQKDKVSLQVYAAGESVIYFQ